MHLSELSDNSAGPSLALRARILNLSSVLEIFLQKVCANTRSQNSHYLSSARARPAQPEFSEYSDYSEFSEFFDNWKFFPVFSRNPRHRAYAPIWLDAAAYGRRKLVKRVQSYGSNFLHIKKNIFKSQPLQSSILIFALAYIYHIGHFNSRSVLANHFLVGQTFYRESSHMGNTT